VTGPQIRIGHVGDRSGFIVATMPREDQYRMGLRLVVGDIYRISPDGQPEKWRAWLWPEAGGDLKVTQHCDAIDAKVPDELRKRLQGRTDRDGPWWGRAEPGSPATDPALPEGGEAA